MTDIKRIMEDEFEEMVKLTEAEYQAIKATSKPNYYAILPADVRYDKNLTYFEKIIYAEICALSNKMGYCFATNDFFKKNFGNSMSTIEKSIKNLREKGYITSIIENVNGTTSRKLYIVHHPVKNEGMGIPPPQKLRGHPLKNYGLVSPENGVGTPQKGQKEGGNNTRYNNTSSIIDIIDDIKVVAVEQKPPAQLQLPDWLGANSHSRLIKLYSLMYEYKFSVPPKMIKASSQESVIIKNLLGQYTEMFAALIIIMHFDWRGVDGMDENAHKRIENAGYPLTWLPTNVQLYFAYIKNMLHVENDKDAMDYLDQALLLITTP